MNRNNRLPILTVLIPAFASLLGMIVRTIAYLTQFDTDVEYFAPGAAHTIDLIILAAAVILPAVCAFLIPGNTIPTVLPERRVDRFAAILPAIGFFAFILLTLPMLGELQAIRLNPNGTGLSVKNAVIVLLILAVGGAAYGLVNFFGWKNLNGRGGIGFFPILWGLIVIAVTYMDQYVAMNSPVKLGIMFGALGMMAAMTAELRYLFGKPAPRAYPVLIGYGAFFGLTGSVPYFFAYIFGKAQPNTLYILFAIVLAVMGMYFEVRLCRFLGLFTDRKEDSGLCE